jgi:hypothetical protein
MPESSGETRALLQEIYVQDLVLALYGVYAHRLRDARGKALLETYLRAEEDRRRRLERFLETRGVVPAPAARSLFAGIGRVYGRVSSRLGTRVMLRIVLSSSRRAARRACVLVGAADGPDLLFLATLRARNEGDLRDDLTQHLIDTRPRPS